jgi:hypothetical protein
MAAATTDQSYDNHRKFVRGYHGVAFAILMINLIYSAYVAVTSFSVGAVVGLLLAFGLLMIAFYARIFALGAQDRVIRLEERLRLRELLSPEQHAVIGTLSTAQLIGLRFASDAEVGELAVAVAAEGLENGEAIKKRVKNWRPDHQRV